MARAHYGESRARALSERAQMKFSELFAGVTSRSEVVVTFLALLELIRLKQIVAVQREPFGEIEVCRAAFPPDSQTAAPVAISTPHSTPDTQSSV